MKRRRIVFFMILTLISVISFGLYKTYGFFNTRVSGNEVAKKAVFNSQVLKVEYSDGSEVLNTKTEGFFNPGSKLIKTFTITNTGNMPVKYSINLTDVINEFERYEDITYELKNGDTILGSGIFPKTDDYIVSKDTLGLDESKTYTLTINYLNSNENQIVDSGKTINAKITFDDSIKTISKLLVYGNSVQQEGKNLFNIVGISPVSNVVITDKSITISGGYAYAVNDFKLNLKPNTKYTFSYYLTRGIAASNRMAAGRMLLINPSTSEEIMLYSGVVYSKEFNKTLITKTFVTPENIDGFTTLRYYGHEAGETVYENIQLEEGATRTDYEIFRYPKPDQPLEIRSLGERTKNLYEYKAPTIANGKVIESLENGAIVDGNDDTAGNYRYTSGWFRPGDTSKSGNGVVLKTGDVVTVSADVTLLDIGNATYDQSMIIHLYSREQNGGYTSWGADVQKLVKNKKVRIFKTFTIDENGDGKTYYPVFCVNSHKVRIENIQITYGENEVDYEPYGKYKIPINVVGKNFFNINKIDVININANASIVNNKNNSITIKNFYAANTRIKLSDFCPSLKVGDTVFLSFKTSGDRDFIYLAGEKTVAWNNNTTRTITQSDLDSNVVFYGKVGQEVNISNIQIERGTSFTTYEPYVEPIVENVYLDEPLRSVGTCATCSDYIDYTNAQIVRNVKSTTLNLDKLGSYNAKLENVIAYLYSQYFKDSNISSQYNTPNMSDQFVFLNGASVSSINAYTVESLALRNNSIYLVLNRERLADIEPETAKNYINSLNTNIIYQLHSPVINSIKSPKLYALKYTNNVNICTSNGVCASNIEVEFDE